MLNPSDLADILKTSLGFSSEPTSTQLLGVAQAIVQEFALGLVSHAPGTVTGTAPSSGGRLALGAALGGTILGMTGASLAANIQSNAGFPSVTAQLLGFANAMTTHFLTGLVNFSAGSITGTCTNTPTSPGVLTGMGVNGLISGYNGPALATLLATGLGQPAPSPELTQMSTDLVTYIMTNATVTYAMGAVTAVCSAGGGPIVLGTATGGTIS